MKQHILSSKISYLLPLVVLVLLVWGCSDRLVDNDTNPVTVKLQTSISVGELADAVSIYMLTVTGPDMEPIVAVQFYDGGPLVFELDIPAGPGRIFVLEGFTADPDDFLSLGRVIYRGSAVADIAPNVEVDLTLHMEPVVPLIRFTPLTTVTASGQSFSVNLEIFNVPGLLQTELVIQYDAALLAVDSIAKGSGLDASDVLEPAAGGDLPGMQVIIYDPNNEGIVDETGYSHLATVYFTSDVTVTSAATALEIVGLSYIASGGARFLPGDVFSHVATVEIAQFAGALLRLLPSDTTVQPEGAFGLRLEAHNLMTLYEADLELAYDNSLLRYDSIVKGGNLTGNDTIIVNEGSAAGALIITVVDTNLVAGSIVDVSGYSHMATVFFTALRPPQTAVTPVEITPRQLLASESVGGSIPVANVTAEGATVTIAAVSNILMSFLPEPPDPMSSEYFTVDVELFNMADLDSVEFELVYETDIIRFDSIEKGPSLDASDAVSVGEGPGAAPIIRVYDIAGGLIVDGQGYSSLLKLYFGTNIISEPISTAVTPSPITFTLLSGGSIPVDNVMLEDATLNISAFPDSILTFPDPGLESAIRDQLLIYEPTPIYLRDVVFVDYLDASWYYGIQSIEGLEVFANMTYLMLAGNDIGDITPLSQLPKLKILDLIENRVSDLSPLETATNLTSLYLRENEITDISALGELYNLQELGLSNYGESSYPNSVSDLSPLSSLTQLKYLDIRWNFAVSDISPLASLTSLQLLYLEGNLISDVSPLADLASVTDLDLSDNSIVDIAPLATGTVLQSGDYVDLRNNPINPDACDTYMWDLITSEVTVNQNSCAYTR